MKNIILILSLCFLAGNILSITHLTDGLGEYEALPIQRIIDRRPILDETVAPLLESTTPYTDRMKVLRLFELLMVQSPNWIFSTPQDLGVWFKQFQSAPLLMPRILFLQTIYNKRMSIDEGGFALVQNMPIHELENTREHVGNLNLNADFPLKRVLGPLLGLEQIARPLYVLDVNELVCDITPQPLMVTLSRIVGVATALRLRDALLSFEPDHQRFLLRRLTLMADVDEDLTQYTKRIVEDVLKIVAITKATPSVSSWWRSEGINKYILLDPEGKGSATQVINLLNEDAPDSEDDAEALLARAEQVLGAMPAIRGNQGRYMHYTSPVSSDDGANEDSDEGHDSSNEVFE